MNFVPTIYFFPGVTITLEAQAGLTSVTLKDFKAKVDSDEGIKAKVEALRIEVENFAQQFPMPGFDDL